MGAGGGFEAGVDASGNPKCGRHKGALGVLMDYNYVIEQSKRESQHAHAHTRGSALPALVADVASVERLAEQLCKALDSQVRGDLPAEYQAIGLAQAELKVSRRRDPAYTCADATGQQLRRLWDVGSSAAATTPAAAVAEFLADTAKRREFLDALEHNGRSTAMNKNSHVHMATCTCGKSGNTGCRMCMPSAHGLGQDKTVCVEFEIGYGGETEWDAVMEFRCKHCYGGGIVGLGEADAAHRQREEDRRQGLASLCRVRSELVFSRDTPFGRKPLTT